VQEERLGDGLSRERNLTSQQGKCKWAGRAAWPGVEKPGGTVVWQWQERNVTNIEDIANRTGAGIALSYRSGEVSPVEVIECLLGRIETGKGDNIFITVTADRARSEALASESRYRSARPLSALDGVPIAWKDIIDIAGAPTTAGSKLFSGGPVKTRDLACAANASAVGMVTMGKLNLTELAYSGLGLNPHFGTPMNPNDRATPRSPGGSSSGSGAAVAARLVPCAVGSDTGGSVRIPAAFNGVVGFKTSCGRIDSKGLVALARTYDTIGPLARSVEDCILLDRVLRGAITAEARRADVRTLAVLVPTNVVAVDAEEGVIANFERSIEGLARSGVAVRRERIEVLDEIMEMTARYGTLTAAEAYHEYREIVDSEQVDQIDRRVTRRIMDGKNMTANDLLSIQRGRSALTPKLVRQLGGALLAMPTTPITAPEVAPLEADDATFHRVNLLTLRNTMLGNVLDLCGMALPNGMDHRGLPTSILFSAPHGEDEALLSACLEIERVLAAISAG
jgi:aspartyl-tRNA(Asn)/glutamyl-tRNA(Gln) amidotransferase subunit A